MCRLPAHRAIALLCAFLPVLPGALADVVISEFMASNSDTLLDEDGDASDWIEIHNDGPASLSLANWSLTDDPQVLAKWLLPPTTIEAGGYLLLFASGKDRRVSGGQLHASFSLSSAGEFLALVAPDGATVVHAYAPAYPPQATDISFGTGPAGWRYFTLPTPGAANGAGVEGLVADTRFSVERGFFSTAFDLEIATATPEARIVYTLDGSTPAVDSNLVLRNGFVYGGPIPIAETTTVRAATFRRDWAPTRVVTHTYLFLDDILAQSPTGTAPPGWPASPINGQVFDYGMDPNIVGREPWRSQMVAALTQIPSLSLVTDLENLFDPRTGIYVNASRDGYEWERPTSLELIPPDGAPGFQVDAGLRIRGGFSRGGFNPKHSFRLFFRRQYGDAKLRFPLFEDEGVDKFDSVDLRTAQNYAWSNDTFNDETRNTFLRDVFSRDLQREQGQPHTRSRYYHLYIGGQYWGLYQTQERSEASYAESYLGPEKEDYDVVKASGQSLEATDGTMTAWNALMTRANAGFATNADYFFVQGKNADGTEDPAYPVHVDVDNLIDFMINVFYTGNIDMPTALGGGGPNNFWAIRDRTARDGWKFLAHDNEHNMLSVSENQTNDDSARNNPKYLHQQLDSNTEYRLRFADRVQKSFFHGGACTPERSRAQMQARIDQIDRAIIAESARWGDQHNEPPLTKDTWRREVDWLMDTFLTQRRDVVLGQLRQKGLYPPASVAAPAFSQHGGRFVPGFVLSLTAPNGSVHYTTDGSDPRLVGGAVSPTALQAGSATRDDLVGIGATVRVLVPRSQDDALGVSWTSPDFADASWRTGQTGVGFERDAGYEAFIATDVETEMFGNTASVYLRVPFFVDSPSEITSLTLGMMYDDGFAAYLNGVRVADRNAPGTLRWNSVATANHVDSEAVVFEEIDIGSFAGALRSGGNVLAVHGMNVTAASSDMLIVPALSSSSITEEQGIRLDRTTLVRARARAGTQWSAMSEALFAADTSDLRITEVMYHPAPDPGSPFGNDQFEFVELANIGSQPLDLSGARLGGAVDFVFPSAAPGGDLAPGELVLVVKNLTAFASRYETSGLRIAGEYDGNLSNGGERVILLDALGETILDFVFSDLWYAATDGGGASLEILDPRGAPDSWDLKRSWLPSLEPGGTPGSGRIEVDGGHQRIGDVNQDGQLDIADAVGLLLDLYGAGGGTLPCGDGTFEDPGNRKLLDGNADGRVDISDAIHVLSFLFTGGPPPVLGVHCRRIEGCPEACTP